MKNLLLNLFLVGIITGIVPAVICGFLFKILGF